MLDSTSFNAVVKLTHLGSLGDAVAGALFCASLALRLSVNRQGWARQGLKSTEEIMGWLRGYDEDATDPGLTTPAGQAKRAK